MAKELSTSQVEHLQEVAGAPTGVSGRDLKISLNQLTALTPNVFFTDILDTLNFGDNPFDVFVKQDVLFGNRTRYVSTGMIQSQQYEMGKSTPDLMNSKPAPDYEDFSTSLVKSTFPLIYNEVEMTNYFKNSDNLTQFINQIRAVNNTSYESERLNSFLYLFGNDNVDLPQYIKTELNKKVDNTIILKTVDEVNSFDRAYQSFIVYNFIADAIGLPGSPSSTWFCIHLSHSKGYQYPSQIAFEYAGLERIMYRTSIKGVWGTWRKISTTGVKDIPKTNIAPADTTKFVGFKGNSMCNYCVQNGICYVSLWGVQVTVTGRVNTGVILPLPKSGFFGGGHLTGGGDAETHAYAHTIPETGELKFNVKDANTALYGAFSYPVAES